MAAVDVDVVGSALRDVNLSSGRETVLKPEQESAVRVLLAHRDVWRFCGPDTARVKFTKCLYARRTTS